MPEASYPAYGMAEATLLISGGRRGAGHLTRSVSRAGLQSHSVAAPIDVTDVQLLVGCGRALVNEQIAIVDPDQRARLSAEQVGEIWVNGPNVARAYWKNPETTETALNAHHRRRATTRWLRTGDLGFLDEAGELFVTGRIKDLIIIRGINHYPQDIERTVQAAHPAFRANCGAAFSVADERGEETLVIVQEIERTERNRIDPAEMKGLDPRKRDRAARVIRAAYRADQAWRVAENHQWQDPAQPGAQAVAGQAISRIWPPTRIDQKSILAAAPNLMLAAIPSTILDAMAGR